MSDITETARRVIELSERAFDVRSLAYQQANEALAGAAPDLARALLESQAALAALTDERDDLKAQRDAMRADVPVDERLLGHLAMTGIAKSHDAYKAQKRAEAERDEARAALAAANAKADKYESDWYAAKSEFGDSMAKARADLARVTAERDRNEREVQRLQNVVCASPACSAAIVRHDDGSRVCAAGHPARWVNVDLLTKAESDITTAREAAREMVAELGAVRERLADTYDSVAEFSFDACERHCPGHHESEVKEAICALIEPGVDASLATIDALLAKHAAPAPTLDFRPLGGRPDPVTQQQHAQAHNAARLKGGE